MRTSLRNALLVALAGVAIGVPALAQGTPSTYATACEKQPSQGDQEAAHASFTLGKKAYDEADYPKAIKYLKDAYELDCTKPDLLKYISSAYVAKGDKIEAIAALEAYVKASPKAGDLDVVQKKITNLKQQLTQPTGSGATTAPTATGTTTAPTGSGTTTAPTSTDTPPPPPVDGERKHGIAPWIVVGGGAAVAIVGGVMIGVGAAQVGDSTKGCTLTANGYDCGSAAKNADAKSKNDSGHMVQNVGVVFTIVGAAAIAGGLVWHFLEPTGPAKAAKTRVTPQVGPGYAGLAIGGSF